MFIPNLTAITPIKGNLYILDTVGTWVTHIASHTAHSNVTVLCQTYRLRNLRAKTNQTMAGAFQTNIHYSWGISISRMFQRFSYLPSTTPNSAQLTKSLPSLSVQTLRHGVKCKYTGGTRGKSSAQKGEKKVVPLRELRESLVLLI